MHSHTWSWVALHSCRTSCFSLQTAVQYWQLSPQCHCSAKCLSGHGLHSVLRWPSQWRLTAVPGGHWLHRWSSKVTGSRCWYLCSCTSWRAQAMEAVKNWGEKEHQRELLYTKEMWSGITLAPEDTHQHVENICPSQHTYYKANIAVGVNICCGIEMATSSKSNKSVYVWPNAHVLSVVSGLGGDLFQTHRWRLMKPERICRLVLRWGLHKFLGHFGPAKQRTSPKPGCHNKTTTITANGTRAFPDLPVALEWLLLARPQMCILHTRNRGYGSVWISEWVPRPKHHSCALWQVAQHCGGNH